MASVEYNKIAKRYAKALFSVTQPDLFDTVSKQLATLSKMWDESADFRQAMINPRVSNAMRADVLNAIVTSTGGWSTEPVKRAIETIVTRRKAAMLPALATLFLAYVEEYRKNLTIEIRTALPMTDEKIGELKGQLSQSLGGEVRLIVKHEPELLGGLTIRMADKLLDRSVAGTLAHMAEQLAR